MASLPTASPATRSRSASSKDSTTRSASSNDEPTACATRNTSASRSSPACFPRYDPPKSPTRFPEDPEINGGADNHGGQANRRHHQRRHRAHGHDAAYGASA